jgi:hypothetical protein
LLVCSSYVTDWAKLWKISTNPDNYRDEFKLISLILVF